MKRISDTERLLTYAMNATKDQLENAVEIFRVALKRHASPSAPRRARTAKVKVPTDGTKSAAAGSPSDTGTRVDG